MASSEDEFEDAVESLESLPNRARVFSPPLNGNLQNDQTPTTSRNDDNPRRRLSAVRNRMRTEFGLGSSNFGGSQNSFDEIISRSDCTSIASWGRNFLSETSNGAQPIAVCPTDTLSTRAQTFPDYTKQTSVAPDQPPPLLPIERRNSRPLPPPLPKRPPPEKLVSQLSIPASATLTPSNSNNQEAEKTTEKENEPSDDVYGKKRGHAKTNSLDRGLTLAKTIKCGPFPPTSSKSNSLNRGISPSIVKNAVCEEEQRINNAHGVINQITLAVLSSSGETDDDGSKITSSSSNLSKNNHKSESKRRPSNISTEEDEAATFRVPTTLNYPSHAVRHGLPAVGEESSTASSTPIRSHPSPNKQDPINTISVPVEIHKHPSSSSLEAELPISEIKPKPSRVSHKRYASNVDGKATSFKQQSASFKECRSATDLDKQPTKSNSTKDPITQDVERRMSMKDYHSTMGSSSRSDASRDQSLHSLQSGFDHARAMIRSYGSTAQTFFRGAYQKARTIVASSSTPKCSSLVGKDDDVLESDAASSTVSMSTSENNIRSYSRIGDNYPVICRPRSSKRGPNHFGQLRVVQEINEHSGAIWALKFSNCGRLLATAGNDNLVRVWVLRHDFEQIQMQMKSKNFGDDDNSSISSRKSPLDSSASTRSCSTQAQSAGISQNTSSSRSSNYGNVFAPKPFCIYRGHTSDILDLAWSPKNYFLLSSGMDHTVKLWHLTRSECLCCFQHADFVTCIAFMPNDDRNFFSGSMDGKVRMWHIPEKKVVLWNEVDQHSNNNRFITAITFYRNKFIIVGTYDGHCFLFKPDLKYHTVLNIRSSRGKNARGHKISSLTVYKDYLLVGSNDSRIRMYNLHNLSLVCKYKGAQIERSQIRASFSPDGRYIISGSEDNYAYIWPVIDLTTALSLHHNDYERVRVHNNAVTAACFAPKPQLFFDLLNEKPEQLAPVYSSAYTKRRELSSPVPLSNPSPAPTSDVASERSHLNSSGILSGLSTRVMGIANGLRASRRNLHASRGLIAEAKAAQFTGEVIVTADQNGSIKVMANPFRLGPH
ncbi:WD repeat-containing protein 44 [Aphelenchoides bicaudatus]|nr:WD repeat-containing protein 44 [Aphelenchoides bicaudatus]